MFLLMFFFINDLIFIYAKPRKICVRLMDGSEIYLGLLSGSNTTVEQLHREIITVAYSKLIQNKPGLKFYMI
jgi:hypothetical protein